MSTVNDSRASRTARLMAVQRGLESARPASGRLFCDPLAPTFVSPAWRAVLTGARVAPLRRMIEALYDRVGGPGPRASAIARTRLIDDLVAAAAPAIDQVVILGAGYDTRAHRLPCLVDRAVFEVDRQVTQAQKRAALTRAAHAQRSPTYVAVDFETDDLATALGRAGHRPQRPTAFLWEGVTQYLSAAAVDATLAGIRRAARPDDTLVFTYVDAAALGDHDRFPEAARWRDATARRGEPWIFGLSPPEVPAYLAARGWHLTEDISTREAGERYFPRLRRPDHGSALYHVATATATATAAPSAAG